MPKYRDLDPDSYRMSYKELVKLSAYEHGDESRTTLTTAILRRMAQLADFAVAVLSIESTPWQLDRIIEKHFPELQVDSSAEYVTAPNAPPAPEPGDE